MIESITDFRAKATKLAKASADLTAREAAYKKAVADAIAAVDAEHGAGKLKDERKKADEIAAALNVYAARNWREVFGDDTTKKAEWGETQIVARVAEAVECDDEAAACDHLEGTGFDYLVKTTKKLDKAATKTAAANNPTEIAAAGVRIVQTVSIAATIR